MTGPSLRIAAACLAFSLLGGCASYSTGSNKGPRSGSGASYSSGSGDYAVEKGDTVYAISRRFDVSVRTLIEINRLSPPYVLYPGQKLTLPASQNAYVVEKGDTLWAVSRKTGVSFTALAEMNNLAEPYHLKVGQKLNVAGAGGRSTASDASAGGVTVIRSSQSGAESAPNATAPSVVAANANDPYKATTGGASTAPVDTYRPLTHRSDEPTVEQKQAPAAIAAAAQASQDSQPNPTTTISAPASNAAANAAAPTNAASPAIAPAVAAAPAQAVPPKPLPDPPKAAGGGYLWPAKGPVIATFGVTGKGQHNDGINIKIPIGTPVFAAENGVVAYAGSEIRGFGNLLLIKHASGWMTAYAHNDQLLVERGVIVKKGQKIALSGDSGGANPPQLHFEVRKGSRAVDPMTMLGSRTGSSASAGGVSGPG